MGQGKLLQIGQASCGRWDRQVAADGAGKLLQMRQASCCRWDRQANVKKWFNINKYLLFQKIKINSTSKFHVKSIQIHYTNAVHTNIKKKFIKEKLLSILEIL